MLALLFSSAVTIFIIFVFGFAAATVLKIPSSFVEKLFIGFILCTTLAAYLSLCFPLTMYLLFCFIIVSVLLAIIMYAKLKSYIAQLPVNPLVSIISILFISVAFCVALSSPKNGDTGLYHIQSIKWIEGYSIVPGLANLHGRFGFNSNIFLLYSLTSFFPMFHQEIFSVNFTILFILILYFVNKLYALGRQQEYPSLFLFYASLFLIILHLPDLSSPSPDYSAAAISFFIFARTVDLSAGGPHWEFKKFLPLLLLSFFVVTIKLSTLPIIFLGIWIIIHFKSSLRKSRLVFPLLIFIILPWLVRNIIITGWLVYPFPTVDLFSFDWKIPVENVITMKRAITGWARIPGTNHLHAATMPITEWAPLWWKELSFLYQVMFSLSIFFPLLILLYRALKKISFDVFTGAVIYTAFLGVLFWFFLAPDWRFGEAFIFTALLSPFLIFKEGLKFLFYPKRLFIFLLFLLAGYYAVSKLFLMVIAASLFILNFSSSSSQKHDIALLFIFILLFGSYLFNNYTKVTINLHNSFTTIYGIAPPKIAIPSNVTFQTRQVSGVEIYLPTVSDKCYDHQLPCTPYLDSGIVLRNNSLQYGFKHVSVEK